MTKKTANSHSRISYRSRSVIFLAPIILLCALFAPAFSAPIHPLDGAAVQNGVVGGSSGKLAPTGIWLSQEEIMQLPTSGPAWDSVLSDAASYWETANVYDQDSNHDVQTMAGALVCARTGVYCAKTIQGLKSAMGTEEDARWLAIGRNMTAYTIAADVLRNSGALAGQDLVDVTAWLTTFLTRTLHHNNTGVLEPLKPFDAGSNAPAQQAAVYAALSAYLGADAPQTTHPTTGAVLKGTQHLDRVWNAFRRYACDSTAPDDENISIHENSQWAFYDPIGVNKCGLNPKGATKPVTGYPGFPEYPTEMRTDGAIVNDMDRGGDPAWPPGYTGYPWVGLQGVVPAAWILHRAGYPAFHLQDRAVFRALDFLWWLDERSGDDRWFLQDGDKAAEVVYLVKVVYGKACNPIEGKDCMSEWEPGDPNPTTGLSRTIGYTDWTHMNVPSFTSVSFTPMIIK